MQYNVGVFAFASPKCQVLWNLHKSALFFLFSRDASGSSIQVSQCQEISFLHVEDNICRQTRAERKTPRRRRRSIYRDISSIILAVSTCHARCLNVPVTLKKKYIQHIVIISLCLSNSRQFRLRTSTFIIIVIQTYKLSHKWETDEAVKCLHFLFCFFSLCSTAIWKA